MNTIIIDRNELLKKREHYRNNGKKVVFTNGCFDILHAGHVDYLTKAKQMGDVLIVALNSDESVRRIKGGKRPITNQEERLFVVSQLKCVDIATLFQEDTPAEIISDLIPDVLVKGADWSIENIVGREVVENHGGIVRNIFFDIDQSTTKIIKKIIESYQDKK